MKKGLNNITLPVYKEIKKELPGIIEDNVKTKPTVYLTDKSITDITDEKELLDKLKVGDIIKSSSDNEMYIVRTRDETDIILISIVSDNGNAGYYAIIYEDGDYYYDEYFDVELINTTIYEHIITTNLSEVLTVYTREKTPIGNVDSIKNINTLLNGCINASYKGKFVIGHEYSSNVNNLYFLIKTYVNSSFVDSQYQISSFISDNVNKIR